MNDSALPGFLVGFGVFGLALVVLTSIFWIWMLIDCLANQRLDGTQKVIWLLVIFFLHLVGAIVYFFVGRSGNANITGASPPS